MLLLINIINYHYDIFTDHTELATCICKRFEILCTMFQNVPVRAVDKGLLLDI